jgi:uncharacterized protein with GYD domain
LCDADSLHAAGSEQDQRQSGAAGPRRKAAEKAGGKVHSWFLTMGKYDAVIVSEFPTDDAAAKFMLATGAAGNVTTQTMKAFTEDEYRKIVAAR